MHTPVRQKNLSGIHPIFESILATHTAFPCRTAAIDEETETAPDAEEAADEDLMDGPAGYDSDADAEERAAMEAERRAEEGEDW